MTKILVVDDSINELELISGYLRKGGYTVIVATDAKEALSKAIEHQPNVIVTDLVMPGMNGLEMCRTLKKNPATQKVPIVACTSKSGEIDRLADLYDPYVLHNEIITVNSCSDPAHEMLADNYNSFVTLTVLNMNKKC